MLIRFQEIFDTALIVISALLYCFIDKYAALVVLLLGHLVGAKVNIYALFIIAISIFASLSLSFFTNAGLDSLFIVPAVAAILLFREYKINSKVIYLLAFSLILAYQFGGGFYLEKSQFFILILSMLVFVKNITVLQFFALSVLTFLVSDSDLFWPSAIFILGYGALKRFMSRKLIFDLSFLLAGFAGIFIFLLDYQPLREISHSFSSEFGRIYSNSAAIYCSLNPNGAFNYFSDFCQTFINGIAIDDYTRVSNFDFYVQRGSGFIFRLISSTTLYILPIIYFFFRNSLPGSTKLLPVLIILFLQGTLQDIFTYFILIYLNGYVRIHRNIQ